MFHTSYSCQAYWYFCSTSHNYWSYHPYPCHISGVGEGETQSNVSIRGCTLIGHYNAWAVHINDDMGLIITKHNGLLWLISGFGPFSTFDIGENDLDHGHSKYKSLLGVQPMNDIKSPQSIQHFLLHIKFYFWWTLFKVTSGIWPSTEKNIYHNSLLQQAYAMVDLLGLLYENRKLDWQCVMNFWIFQARLLDDMHIISNIFLGVSFCTGLVQLFRHSLFFHSGPVGS